MISGYDIQNRSDKIKNKLTSREKNLGAKGHHQKSGKTTHRIKYLQIIYMTKDICRDY